MSNDCLFLNKYQPKIFTDFEIDNDIIDILNTLIKMDNLNILFVGIVGCGKTVILNAMVREYYKGISQKNYTDNVLHINSLKEQGINYYRNDMKTFCQTTSIIPGKKKIIILDDIDIINEQSQQVFRNCIDKYQHNVHFISSCNNPQKVIDTLQSRLIIISLPQLKDISIINIMNKVIHNEQIIINLDAQKFILNICNNTVKVLINYLEKIKLLDQVITLELAMDICTNITFITFEKYITLLNNNQINDAICIFYNLHEQGYSVMDILDNFFLYIKTTPDILEEQKYNVIPFICKYITSFHNIHEDEIELALFTHNLSVIFNK